MNDILKTINELHAIQKSQPTSRTDDYMRGMYNGIEVIRASITDHKLNLIDKSGMFDSEIKDSSDHTNKEERLNPIMG